MRSLPFKATLTASLLALGFSAHGATQTVSNAQYTLTYDDSSPLGLLSSTFSASGNVFGFTWDVPDSVTVGNGASNTWTLPSFTVVANSGYLLSNLGGSLGKLSYASFGGSTTASASGTLNVNGNTVASGPVNLTLKSTSSYGGYYNYDANYGGSGIQSFAFTAGLLTLTAGPNAVVLSTGQPQMKVSFIASAVAEPESYAMMLAGLGAMGLLAVRRRRR